MRRIEPQTVEAAAATLVLHLKAAGLRKRAISPGQVVQNLLTPPTTTAGSAGPAVTDPWWGAGQTALAGAGLGGALGLGRAVLDLARRKRVLQEALNGALMGGGIGGGLGLAAYGGNYLANHAGAARASTTARPNMFTRAWRSLVPPTATAAADAAAAPVADATTPVDPAAATTPPFTPGGGLPAALAALTGNEGPDANAAESIAGGVVGASVGSGTGFAYGRNRDRARDNAPAIAARATYDADLRGRVNALLASNAGSAHQRNIDAAITANPVQSPGPGLPAPTHPITNALTNATAPLTALPGLPPGHFEGLRTAANSAHPLPPASPILNPRRARGRIGATLGGVAGGWGGAALPAILRAIQPESATRGGSR